MRSTPIVLAAALATAACSSGPSAEQKQDAQTEMKSCADNVLKKYAPQLSEVTARLDGIDAPNYVKKDQPDFTVRGNLAPYEEKSGEGKKMATDKYDVGLAFESEAGKLSATLAGMKTSTDQEGRTRNFPLFSQDVDVASNDFKGIDIAAVLRETRACAVSAQNKLGLK